MVQLPNKVKHTALAKCRVLYMGSAVPTETNEGLETVQQPLRERYPVEKEGNVAGIDAWLTVFTSGMQMQYVDDPSRIVWFPIQTLHLCAAVKAIVTLNGSTGEKQAKFLSVDSSGAKQSTHPPIFCCVMRRSQGRKVLECHIFITKKVQSATQLVMACNHAYIHREGWTEDAPSPETIGSELTGNITAVNLLPAEILQEHAPPEFFEKPPSQGYFYATGQHLVKKFNLYGGGSQPGGKTQQQQQQRRSQVGGPAMSLPLPNNYRQRIGGMGPGYPTMPGGGGMRTQPQPPLNYPGKYIKLSSPKPLRKEKIYKHGPKKYGKSPHRSPHRSPNRSSSRRIYGRYNVRSTSPPRGRKAVKYVRNTPNYQNNFDDDQEYYSDYSEYGNNNYNENNRGRTNSRHAPPPPPHQSPLPKRQIYQNRRQLPPPKQQLNDYKNRPAMPVVPPEHDDDFNNQFNLRSRQNNAFEENVNEFQRRDQPGRLRGVVNDVMTRTDRHHAGYLEGDTLPPVDYAEEKFKFPNSKKRFMDSIKAQNKAGVLQNIDPYELNIDRMIEPDMGLGDGYDGENRHRKKRGNDFDDLEYAMGYVQ